MMTDHFLRPVITHHSLPEPVLSARFGDALNFACALHRNHSRKGTTIPYSSHLLSVSAIVLEHGGTEEEAIGALLHDAIEDQSGDNPAALKQEIKERFGQGALDIVIACSDAESSENKGEWRTRKERYIGHLAEISASARLVSMADKLHNARSILADYRRLGNVLWDRFNGGREGTLWYYRALVNAFRASGGPASLLDEIERTVREMEDLAAGHGSSTV